MFSPRHIALVVATLFTLGIAGNASADTILALEDFYTAGDQAMSAQGWFAYYDSGAGTVDRSATTTSDNSVQMKNSYLVGSGDLIVANKGCVLFKSAIDSTPENVPPVQGLLGKTFDASDAVELEDYTDVTFSWEQWSVYTNATTSQVALQVDSTWYVSTELMSNPNADGAADAGGDGTTTVTWHLESNNGTNTMKTFVIDSATEWHTLSFTLGTDAATGNAMTVGTTSVALPTTGTINGVGLYGVIAGDRTSGTYLGLDNFEVTATAVPEPPALLLLFLAAGSLLVWKRC